LTTIIALGATGSKKYYDMAKDPVKRKKFVNSAVDFLKEHDFDGLDIKWEYPSNSDGDKANIIILLTELKAAFEPHGFLLSLAVYFKKETIDSTYDITKLNDLLDFINVMTYDYHGDWENRLGHNAPLYKTPDEHDELNVYYTVNYYIEKGMDKKKMVMGIPFYGRAWTLESPDKVHLNDTAKGTSPPEFISGRAGFLGYNEVSKIIQIDFKVC
jgi:chitinase